MFYSWQKIYWPNGQCCLLYQNWSQSQQNLSASGCVDIIITDSAILDTERICEAATLVMSASVALLTGANLKQRIAYFFLAFGIWDIFYYVFLRLTIGWPQTLVDLDIFFLLPFPWVGPVFVPVAVSTFLIFGSLWFVSKESVSYRGKKRRL